MTTLDGLPFDSWGPAVARCLTGWDLFELARASRWTWQCFSQDAFWRDRLTRDEEEAAAATEGEMVALPAYMRAFSLQFKGLPTEVAAGPQRGACAQLDSFYEEFVRQRGSFAFDLWFSVLEGMGEGDAATGKPGVFTGGILLGGQSSSYDYQHWADYHLQFAIVSSDRTLYCSVLDAKPEIATQLECNRWYHLALTYDAGSALQKVYLDGQLVSTLEGSVHREWWQMAHVQVGTGCITAGARKFPRENHCNWYGFHGLLDAFRVWKKALSGEEIAQLAEGSASESEIAPAHSGLLWYSLKRDMVYFPPKNTMRVGCSRPRERVALVRGSDPQESSQPQPRASSSAASRSDRSNWQQNRRANPTRRGRPQHPGPSRPDYTR